METITNFLVERKESIKISFVEKYCGMPTQSLKPGTVGIPEKYRDKLIEVLRDYYSFPSINMDKGNVDDGISIKKDNEKIHKDGFREYPEEPIDFYHVPKDKVIYKANNGGLVKTKNRISGQWERKDIPYLFIILRVKDPMKSVEYLDDDILKRTLGEIKEGKGIDF